MSAPDLDVRAFVRILRTLPAWPPITAGWDKEHRARHMARRSQREHMVGWFESQPTLGSGAYSRREPNHSARITYNRLLSVGGLLWIGEAMGAPRELVQRASEEAARERDNRRRCGIIRRHIPWEMIASLAAEREAALPPRPVRSPNYRPASAGGTKRYIRRS